MPEKFDEHAGLTPADVVRIVAAHLCEEETEAEETKEAEGDAPPADENDQPS